MQYALNDVRLRCAAGPCIPSCISESCAVAKAGEADEEEGKGWKATQQESKKQAERGRRDGNASTPLS